jgi:hypothetical protein
VALTEQSKGWPFFFMHGIPTSVSATPLSVGTHRAVNILHKEDALWLLSLDFLTRLLKKALFITFSTYNFPILRISLNWLTPALRM